MMDRCVINWRIGERESEKRNLIFFFFFLGVHVGLQR